MAAPPTTERLEGYRELLYTDRATGTLMVREYQLRVVAGPDVGRVVPLKGVVRVGSLPGLELTLTDSSVSRQHAELISRPEGVTIRDFRSTNGTHLMGMEVTEVLAAVQPSLRVRFGRTEVEIAAADQPLSSGEGPSSLGSALASSPKMRNVLGLLARAARSDASLLMLGETGTGKSLLAAEVHRHSERNQGRFEVLNCGAIPSQLIESELFGHVKGAFTGAQSARQGAFVKANRGTLFLDEVGELPLEAQPKLLRVLEQRCVKPVGGDTELPLDVRVIAATHADLRERVASGHFREDLYFRLAVIEVTVPPLRERLEELRPLVRRFCQELGAAETSLPPGFINQLQAREWPGNLRELRNVVERAVVLGQAGVEGPSTETAPAPSTSASAHRP